MKERHKHLDSRVKKVRSNILEDVKRHVWKVRFETQMSVFSLVVRTDMSRSLSLLTRMLQWLASLCFCGETCIPDATQAKQKISSLKP